MTKSNQIGSAVPVKENQRIVAIDVLRGFALLGILLMNIQSFAMPDDAYFNPTNYGNLEGLNYGVWAFSHIFADQKFMTIFSLLFGAGILLITNKLESRGQSALGLHYRRNIWLLVFGLSHALLLWTGDILTAYALCAFWVYWLRKLKPMWLLIIGLIVMAVSPALLWLGGATMDLGGPEVVEELMLDWQPTAAMIQQDLDTYRGSWLTQMESRIPGTVEMLSTAFLFWALWRAGGLMLVGMALYKWGVLTAKRSQRFYMGMIILGFGLGIPIVAYGLTQNFAQGWTLIYSKFGAGSQFNYWGSLFVSSGYIGVIMLISQRGIFAKAQDALAAVGRMALSNYLLHTLICTTLFFGHGFGLYGSVERTTQLLIVVAIWIVQLILSPLWLRHFRFGPFEWLWRSLTYWQIQPMRRT